ncbi:ENHANCER OF LHP1 1-like protein, partial [Drosera capensis]
MKPKSLKLKHSHNPTTTTPSFCLILWDGTARRIVTASASDPSIIVHNAGASEVEEKAEKVMRHHRDGVSALAMSPNSTCLASGSVDRSVKLYKFPSGEFETNITRFTLPIRTLAFNKSGSMLAAAGDDEGIKLINTIDGTIARVLKGHKRPVTCLAFDPNNEYLASVDSRGTVIYWELCSGDILHNLIDVAPDCGSETSVMNVISWSPDGEMLAVPGNKNDVIMHDRDTAEKLYSLRGDHSQSVCFLSWSPNGKYLATSGLDKQVLIWDVEHRQDIDRQKLDEKICCMAWKPIGNALAVIDVMGKYGIWESVIPSSMKSPTEDIPSVQSKNANGLLLFDEDEQEPSVSGTLSDLGEESNGESEPLRRKRLRKQTSNYISDEDNDVEIPPSVELPKKLSREHKERHKGGIKEEKEVSSCTKFVSTMQSAFQPGATPMQPGARCFLCYNMLGTITTIAHDAYSHIEVDFHDTSQGPRVPPMTDYFGFTMASLDENGSIFANPGKGEKHLSTLMYRPFKSWANNSERHVLSLAGPVVTAAGYRDELAIVTHSSQPLSSNDQMLEFRVFNISNGTEPYRGHLPITPGSTLKWFGFSEEGQLSSYDSKGVLRVYTNQFGGSWFPLFSASSRKKPEENYWVVGLNAEKLFCIVCKSPDLCPKVNPKPVLTLLDLSIPLACSDLGADVLENEFILRNIQLWKTQKRIDEMMSLGLDTTALDDEAFNMETALDRCILRLIASCCNGDKLQRATELVKLLSLEKSVKGAIKLVTTLKLPYLAEKFNSILEERLLGEKNWPLFPPSNFNSETVFRADQISKALATSDAVLKGTAPMSNGPMKISGPTEMVPVVVPNAPLPPSEPQSVSPFFRKKAKLQDGFVGNETKQDRTSALDNKQINKNVEMETLHETTSKPSMTSSAKIPINPDSRPKNPFAKPSNIQEKPSLLDSIKKIKTDAAGK